MIHKSDEFLHEYVKKDWVESYSLNIIDKKNKTYGCIDIDYLFDKNKIEIGWAFFVNNIKYDYHTKANFNRNLENKKICGNNFEYSIVKPLETFKLNLKNEFITARLNITGIFPIYDFPANIADDGTSPKPLQAQPVNEIRLWNIYQQRCKITGNILIKKGTDKGKKVTLNSIGQREHLWGKKQQNKIGFCSNITVQFRDMTMNLMYIEKEGIPVSNGFISRRSGNIPIVNVECESIAINENRNAADSTEFSYKDAQDDVDLLVSRTIHSIPLPLIKKTRSKCIKFRNFSEFTIIGTNKKGIGIEDHFILLDRLKKM